ncbi:MAG: hypothetical protein WAM28_07560 [Chlamydiales bacterium]
MIKNNFESRNPAILDAVKNADQETLLNLLNNANVSVGHWNGRLISVPGYSGHITFSKFSSRVEEIYQETVYPMLEKFRLYITKRIPMHLLLPIQKPAFMNYFLLLFTVPRFLSGFLESVPHPIVSENEEKEITDMLRWRVKIDTEFNRLVENSQGEVDRLATESCNWRIIKIWDSILNTRKACENTNKVDLQVLAKLVKARNNGELLPQRMKVSEGLDEIMQILDFRPSSQPFALDSQQPVAVDS